MDKNLIQNRHKEIADLILQADKLIDRLSRVRKKEELKNKTLDKLAYFKGLKSPVDKMIKKNTDLSLARANNAFNIFVEEAANYLDTTKILTKSPSFNINYDKEGMIQYFANDLNIRMANIDIDKQIKDLKRIRNALYLKMKKTQREKEQLEIEEKFAEIKNKVAEL